jgi:hypothetical protein
MWKVSSDKQMITAKSNTLSEQYIPRETHKLKKNKNSEKKFINTMFTDIYFPTNYLIYYQRQISQEW